MVPEGNIFRVHSPFLVKRTVPFLGETGNSGREAVTGSVQIVMDWREIFWIDRQI